MKGDMFMETQYIGARYVPKFYENSHDPSSMEWESGKGYEALTVVTWNDDTYTSKKPVPSGVGNPASNPTYWAKTGNFNAALESLQEEISNVKNGGLNDNVIEYDKLTTKAKNVIEENARVIFMPNTEVADTTHANGACSVFVTKHTKQIIMYDSGRGTDYNAIKTELVKNGIEHIDFFVLTHYHGDHYENIPSLKSDGFIDNGTIAYLPRDTSAVSGWDEAQALVRSYFANNEVVTIDSSNPLIVDNFKFEFFNCDATTFNYYEQQGYTAGNIYSVCSYVHSDDFVILMSGDIDGEAVEYMASLHKFKNCNVFNVPHHGISSAGTRAITLCVNPQFALIQSGAASEYTHDAANDGHYHYINSATVAMLNAMTVPVYSTGYGALYLEISKDIYTLLNNGKNVCSYRTANTEIEIFVDASYVGVGHGTSSEPFNSIKAALAFVNTLNYMQKIKITIVGSYNYPSESVSISANSCELEIAGSKNDDEYNVKVGYFNIENANVTLRDINFKATNHHAVQITKGTVMIVDCLIDGDTTSYNDSYQGAGVTIEEGNVVCVRVAFENKNICIYGNRNGSAYIENCTSVNNNFLISGQGGESLEITGDLDATHFITQRYASNPPFSHLSTNKKNFATDSPYLAYSDNNGGTSDSVTIDLSARIYYNRIFRIYSNNGEVWQMYKDGSGNLTTPSKVQDAIDSSIDSTFAVSVSGKNLTITYSSIVKVIAM